MVLVGSIVYACMCCMDHSDDYVCRVDSKMAYRLQEVWLSDVCDEGPNAPGKSLQDSRVLV